MQREESEAARKAAAVRKLRGSYQVEAKKRALAGTDVSLSQECYQILLYASSAIFKQQHSRN